MNVRVETRPVSRLRAFEVTPALFVWIAAAAVLSLWAIVATGALVRLTSSGLGCEHWPGCTAGNPFPAKGYHSFIEFGNRMLGLFPIVLSIAVGVAAWFVRGLPRWTARLAVAVCVGTFAQAPLGYLTVRFDLNPLLVISHLLLALVVLAGGVIVALEARGLERGRSRRLLPVEVARAGLALAASGFVLLVTGTLATAAGPHSGGVDIHRLGTLDTAILVHAASTAVFFAVLVFLVGYLAASRGRAPGLFRAGLVLFGLVVAQMAIGEIQYRTHLPWGMVLVHVTLAAAAWGMTVALVTLLWRPLASLGPSR